MPRATASTSGRVKHKNTLKIESPPPSKKLKASKGATLHSISLLSTFKPGNHSSSKVVAASTRNAKGKGKATSNVSSEDRLWVEKYEPRCLTDLAVHKRKVDDVRRWLTESFGEQGHPKHRRLLVLSGPAGSAKTTTVRVLAQEMDFEITEYKNATSTNANHFSTFASEPSTSDAPDAFAAFLTRASAYTSVFASRRRKVVLVEDLPNILHPAVRARFHDALRAHVEGASDIAPVVLVVSDAGVRAEGDSNHGARDRELVVDARTVVPPSLSTSLVSEIRFNAIAHTLLTGAVKRVTALANVRLLPNTLHSIVDGASGDVRSAIMTLEFTCGTSSIISTTQRENGLLLFHLIGKLMYNKRKGDPPSRSASAKEIARDRALDRSLKDPPPLPSWSVAEERRPSRVDIQMLYASTPIDGSLLGLYIHQNYIQYCSNIEQCSSLIDNLSWTDSNGSENWYDANPHAFHIQTLGTLHSLPSPVPHTGQRIYKPAFFGALGQEQRAREALDHTSSWLSTTRPWPRDVIATELGSVLRGLGRHAPAGHRAFSELVFGQDSMGIEVVNEGDVEGVDIDYDQGGTSDRLDVTSGHELELELTAGCDYLEDDDIEDW